MSTNLWPLSAIPQPGSVQHKQHNKSRYRTFVTAVSYKQSIKLILEPVFMHHKRRFTFSSMLLCVGVIHPYSFHVKARWNEANISRLSRTLFSQWRESRKNQSRSSPSGWRRNVQLVRNRRRNFIIKPISASQASNGFQTLRCPRTQVQSVDSFV